MRYGLDLVMRDLGRSLMLHGGTSRSLDFVRWVHDLAEQLIFHWGYAVLPLESRPR
jgi:hypothetical protein